MDAGAFKGPRILNSKEAKTGAVLFRVRRAKCLEISRFYVLLDATEVTDAINGVEDYSIITFILDIFVLLF